MSPQKPKSPFGDSAAPDQSPSPFGDSTATAPPSPFGDTPHVATTSGSVPGMEKLGGTPPGPPAALQKPLPNDLKPEDQQEQSFITSPHGLIRTGLREAGRGVAALTRPTTDEKFGAASQIVRGLGKAALPAAIPLAVANPVAAAGTVIGGGLGGAVGGKIAEVSGAGPGVQAASEDAGAMLGGGLGAKGATKLRTAVADSFKIKPDVASAKIWRPGPADSDFPEVTPDAVSEVKTYGNRNVRTNAETKVAAQQAVDTLQNHMNMWLDRARQSGTRINGDSIVQATERAIPETMRLEDPEGVRALIEQTRRAYGGRDFSTDQFRQYLKEKNAGSAAFYNKSGAQQYAGTTSGTPAAIEKAQGDGIREALYAALDPENNGAGPREIQMRTGRVIDLRNAADRRSNAILGEKTVSRADTVGRVAAGIGNIPGKILHGDVEGAFSAFMHPGQGTSDPLVARLFQDVPDARPIPKPGPMVRAPKQITAGSIKTPPPDDASFVRSVPAMAQPPNPRRGLPPASTVQVPPSPLTTPTGQTVPPRTGTPGPDASFVSSSPALINPKTGQPWTAKELKTVLGGFNRPQSNRIIGGNIQ